MLERRELTKFERLLAVAEQILLITHQFPDGDGLAAVLALRRAFLSLGKRVTAVTATPVPEAFHFLPDAAVFQSDFILGDYDVVVTLDCGDLRRTGFEVRLRRFAATVRRLINIDHHPKNDLSRLANVDLTSSDAAATTQLVHELYHHFAWPLDHDVATLLLCGLHTDTGGFKHPNTTPEVLEVAADLLRHGARLQEITRHIHHRRSVAMLRLWGVILDRLHFHQDLGIVSSVVTLEDLRRCAADQADVAGVVNLIKTIPTAKIAILFTEQEDGSVKASLRASAPDVNVARLAALFGGGGLKKAGGFSIPGRMRQTATGWQIVWN